MKKHWTKIVIALAPTVILASVVWEFARMNPDYNFLVAPWALRGYETDHGIIYATMAILLLVGGVATAWEGAVRDVTSAVIAGYLGVAATVFAFVFADQDVELTMSPFLMIALSLITAMFVAFSLRSQLRERVPLVSRALPITLVGAVVLFILLQVTVGGETLTLPVWAVTLFVAVLVGGLAISLKPMNMAANRALIVAAVGAWGMVTFSGGAVRQHLLDTQLDTPQANGVLGVSAQYKDTQTGFGWWLAGLAATLLFVGAVGLWAKRRDIVAALARARRQREAAEISAREIQEAAEAYERERQSREQAPST